MHLPHETKISGVLQRFQDRAAEVAVLLQQHGGRQVMRRGIDRVAKQQKLHYREHDDHRERDAVAPELNELLDRHRIAAPPEAEACFRNFGAAWGVGCAHWKLSFDRLIRSMNTSSSDGSLASQCKSFRSRHGAILVSSAARSRPDTCRLVPNGAIMSIPGWPASWS